MPTVRRDYVGRRVGLERWLRQVDRWLGCLPDAGWEGTEGQFLAELVLLAERGEHPLRGQVVRTLDDAGTFLADRGWLLLTRRTNKARLIAFRRLPT